MKKLLLLLIIPFLSFGQDDCVYYCSNPNACNYSPNAAPGLDDIYCSFPQEYYDCFDNCINDVDGDGVCDELEYLGCMDENACNYSDEAIEDNGSCQFVNDTCGGSTFILDVNGNISVVPLGIWNQNCECVIINGCEDPDACSYMLPSVLGECSYPGEPFAGYWDIQSSILGTLTVIGTCQELSEECECCYLEEGTYPMSASLTVCYEYICGCMDETACNYDQGALLSNNSCLYDDECVGISDLITTKKILRTIDILGKQATNKGLQLHIYDDGSVEKKYLIK
jgi:hypothetical protein